MTVSSLRDRLIERISLTGPMTVADYMAVCLTDPQQGYYTTGTPFGRGGDFITAPEISQMFGELIGAWLLQIWLDMGEPANIRLIELGPGRGTLMADALRTLSLRPDFLAKATLHLVEVSAKLRQTQMQTLASSPLKPTWHDRLEDVPNGPTLLVANEFFDALPIHQYVKTITGWQERVIGLKTSAEGKEEELTFGLGPGHLPPSEIPARAKTAADGSILEVSPTANAVATIIATRLKEQQGAALLVDYGYLQSSTGDTFQALHHHAYDDVLAHPGAADLTAHVNFEALARAARLAGALPTEPLEQGDFLLKLGLLERAGALGRGKDAKTQEEISNAVERLAGPDQMGSLFKALALSDGSFVPAPFDAVAFDKIASHRHHRPQQGDNT